MSAFEVTIRRLAAKPVRRVIFSPCLVTIEFEDGEVKSHKFDIHLRLFLITMHEVELVPVTSSASSIPCPLKYWQFLGWTLGAVATFGLIESHAKPMTIRFS